MLDEVTGRQGLDLFLVDQGLVTKIERLQALDEGKAGELSAHGDVLGRLGRDLLGEDAVQEIGERELLSGGVLEQGLQPLATLEQARPAQMLLQAFELSGLLARASMPATVS
jgi:hypothetical protein